MTNREFLEAIFGDDWQRVHVTSFPGDPGKPPKGVWAGGPAGDLLGSMSPEDNNYFTVSLFKGDRRQAQHLERWVVLGVDDVGPKVDAFTVVDLLSEPTWRVETSPGNEQWLYVLGGEPITDYVWANAFIKALVVKLVGEDGKDPGMRDVTRYLRLPVGRNLKPAYGPGGVRVKLHHGDASSRTTIVDDEMARRIGVSPWSPGTAGTAQATPRVKATSAEDAAIDALADQDTVFQVLREMNSVLAGPRTIEGMGRGYDIVCPWVDEHTDRATTGTVYVPHPGRFKCHHGHCIDRTAADVRMRVDEVLKEESGHLESLARRDFEDVDQSTLRMPDLPARVETKAERAFFARYVWIEPLDKFLDTRSQTLVRDLSVNSLWLDHLLDVLPRVGEGRRRHPMSPATWFRGDERGRRADGTIYWPGEADMVVFDRQHLVNLWHPLDWPLQRARVDDAAVKPWLDLFWYVIGTEPEDLVLGARVLDWLAMVLASSLKGGWQVVLIGRQGIGKDMILQPLMRTLGRRGELVRADDLNSGFTEWTGKRLVQMSEIRQTTRGSTTPHDQMAKLKSAFDPGKEWMTVNVKYGLKYPARNVVMGWLTSNDDTPLRLEDGDRRFLVLDRRCVDPETGAYYARIAAWYEQENGLALVAEWLHRRWESMSADRRRALAETAPMTQAKALMIEVNEDPVDAWLRERIDELPPDPGALPDVVSVHHVTERLLQAKKEGWFGSTMVNAHPTAVGQRLAKMGAVRLNNGNQVRVRGRRERIWAVRNPEIYLPLTPTELAKICDTVFSADPLAGSH